MKASHHTAPADEANRMRVDKWLWAARFYKTRALAVDEIGKGRVRVNGVECKPAREVKAGDSISLRQGTAIRTLTVLALSHQRGPAPKAQLLYAETPESVALRESLAEQRRLAPEPAHSMDHGRPTKRDRRKLQQNRNDAAQSDPWGARWSARLEEGRAS